MQDSLRQFIFEHFPVRGEVTQLQNAWQTVLQRRSYPPPVQRLLGEALAATSLLYATIKFKGVLTLQLQGQGPLNLLLVHCTSDGSLRGLARWRRSGLGR